MYTDKITQAVAEAVKQILATEKLHPNQQKLDVHEPEKDELTSNDFKMLRKGKKADVKEGWQDMLDDVKKRAGPQPSGGSGVKQGSRYGGSKQKDEPEDKKPMKEEVEIVYEANIEPTSAKSRSHIGNLSNPTVNSVEHSGKQIGIITKQSNGQYYAHHSAAKLAHAQSGTFDNKDKAHQFIRDAHAKAIKNNTLKSDGVQKEEVEIQEAEALVENFEIINEVSLGAKIRAYASHSGNAFAHDDMGNDKEYKHHSVKANKIIAHIEKHHGKEAVKHAERAAHSQIFGHPDHEHSGEDRLSGGLRGNKNLTKAGKVPKNTVSAMKNKIMAYGRHRDTAGPKAKLPEEVEQIDEKHMTEPEMKKKEEVVKSMKKGLTGFKERYGDKAKSVMYATATKIAKDKA